MSYPQETISLALSYLESGIPPSEVEAGTRPAPTVPELLAEIAATRAVANY